MRHDPRVFRSAASRTPLIVLAVAAAVFAASCWALYTSDGAVKGRERDARLAEATAPGQVASVPRIAIDVMTVERKAAAQVAELSGVLEPVRATWVAAEIAGSIVAVPAAEHAAVEQAEVLVRLDPSLPEAEVIRAEASHGLAKTELERQRQLGTRSVASKSELDRAVAEERRSYAALLEARTRLGRTQIRAPFDGLVNSLDLDPGAYVSPGTPVAEVLDVSTLELTVLVGDRQVSAVSVGDAVRVRVDSLGSRIVEGIVARAGRAPQSDTQRFPVVIALENPGGALLPGMLAHALLDIGTAPMMRLPAVAVQREFELDYVFVIDEADRAQRVRVATRPVAFRPDQIEVVEGLTDGARVAVSGVSQLRSGVVVESLAVSAP